MKYKKEMLHIFNVILSYYTSLNKDQLIGSFIDDVYRKGLDSGICKTMEAIIGREYNEHNYTYWEFSKYVEINGLAKEYFNSFDKKYNPKRDGWWFPTVEDCIDERKTSVEDIYNLCIAPRIAVLEDIIYSLNKVK